MAGVQTGRTIIGITAGTTWGTAAALTGAKAFHGRIGFTVNDRDFFPNDVGFDNLVREIEKLEHSVDVVLQADLAYHSPILEPIACFCGTDTVDLLNDPDGEDYSHAIVFDEENDGEFSTICFNWGSAASEVIELPSVKWGSLLITQQRADVGQVEVRGIADRIVISSPTNDKEDLDALTYPTYQVAKLAGANMYVRLGAFSDSATMTNTSDKQVVGYRLELTRPMERRFVTRGASTIYTLEPHQAGPARGTFALTFSEINHTAFNGLNAWSAQSAFMAEIFQEGAKIAGDAGNANASYKFQMPRMKLREFPTSYDAPNNNSRREPTYTFEL